MQSPSAAEYRVTAQQFSEMLGCIFENATYADRRAKEYADKHVNAEFLKLLKNGTRDTAGQIEEKVAEFQRKVIEKEMDRHMAELTKAMAVNDNVERRTTASMNSQTLKKMSSYRDGDNVDPMELTHVRLGGLDVFVFPQKHFKADKRADEATSSGQSFPDSPEGIIPTEDLALTEQPKAGPKTRSWTKRRVGESEGGQPKVEKRGKAQKFRRIKGVQDVQDAVKLTPMVGAKVSSAYARTHSNIDRATEIPTTPRILCSQIKRCASFRFSCFFE